jgi:hypothetical protein
MLVGKALATGHGFVYDGVVGSPPAAKFPPLYPLLLAGFWKIFGTIGATTLAATFLNLGLLAVAGGLFAKALHEAAGLSLRLSVVSAGLGFAATDLLRTALIPLSESVFMALMASALVLWPRVVSDERPRRAATMLSLVLVATVATRTAGVALVLAFALALATRPRISASLRRHVTRRLNLMTAVAVSFPPLAFAWGWSHWSTKVAVTIPEGARDLLGPYGSWLADQTLAAPVPFLRGLPSHGFGLMSRVAAILLPGLEGWPMWVAATLLLPVGLYGLWRMFERFPPLAWFTVGYLAMLMLWPYLDRRLVVPIHPAVVATLALGASELLVRIRSRRFEIGLLSVGVVWVLAYSSVTAFRIADGWPTAPYRLRSDRLAASVEALRRTAPADAIVGAPEFWAALHLHGGWTVTPSTRFDPRSVDPEAPIWGTPDEQIAHWRSSGIDHLLLEQAGQLHGAALDQLEDACPGTVFVLAEMETSLVVRIDWDAVCDSAAG